jgi:hypothetical protein
MVMKNSEKECIEREARVNNRGGLRAEIRERVESASAAVWRQPCTCSGGLDCVSRSVLPVGVCLPGVVESASEVGQSNECLSVETLIGELSVQYARDSR